MFKLHLHKWKLIHVQDLYKYYECLICGKRKVKSYSGKFGNGYQEMKYPNWKRRGR